eukprot:CAMPEP_0182536424 /NCGR_PEP_ID=MMETSP1323-20130603/19978_1 /TAXON_ID=236787 /ORGANISM="Florenciella parvula, Strain RCC1693" /LENGTH=104 /DNA_ID=CAMNT_0024746657 /DNA_START=48 /DNA_END=362 /DNA_ORIENTATION=+
MADAETYADGTLVADAPEEEIIQISGKSFRVNHASGTSEEIKPTQSRRVSRSAAVPSLALDPDALSEAPGSIPPTNDYDGIKPEEEKNCASPFNLMFCYTESDR